MNKVTNILLLLFSFPILIYCIFTGLDLPLEFLHTTGAQLPYQQIVFAVLGLILFILVFRRSLKRWMGIKLVNQKEKFVWNEPVTSERKKRVVTYNFLELLVLTSLAIGTFSLSEKALFVSLGYGLGSLDSLIFIVAGLKPIWRVGITKKAILMSDRDVRVLYFTGLRKISFSQETLYFDYIKDLHMNLPLTPVGNKKEFLLALDAQINQELVYWDHSAKVLKENS
jgi:hypothetical protein